MILVWHVTIHIHNLLALQSFQLFQTSFKIQDFDVSTICAESTYQRGIFWLSLVKDVNVWVKGFAISKGLGHQFWDWKTHSLDGSFHFRFAKSCISNTLPISILPQAVFTLAGLSVFCAISVLHKRSKWRCSLNKIGGFSVFCGLRFSGRYLVL